MEVEFGKDTITIGAGNVDINSRVGGSADLVHAH
jgi:hypothetical protein